MALVKLTTRDHKTRVGHSNETTWGEGVEHTASGVGPLCSKGWLHAYQAETVEDAALLAVFMNRTHADLSDPIAWECEGDPGLDDHGLKCGCTRLRTVRQIPLPELTMEQLVRAAIAAARVCPGWVGREAWEGWANAWLSGEDRSCAAADAARAAARAAYAAADAAAARAADAATDAAAARAAAASARAAAAAARAADAAAARAAAAASAAWAADAAAWAAASAASAAYAAADAAADAADADAKADIDLGAVIIAALKEE